MLKRMGHFCDIVSNGSPTFSCCTENFAEIASGCEEKQREMSATQKDGRYLHHLREALRRIGDGAYGICRCGKEISRDRLEALPHATMCIECKSKEESGALDCKPYLGAEPGCCGHHCQ